MTARTVAQAPAAALVALSPRARRRLLAAAAAALLLAAGYFGWLRDSSLVAVEKVRVSGLTAPSSERIERALVSAAEEMTTLHVRAGELERAVSGFPVVDRLVVSTDFPHGLHVRVVEHRPVAVLETGGDRVPVAGDGTVLPDVESAGSVPRIRAGATLANGRLADSRARLLVAVVGAAPEPLLRRAVRVGPAPGRGIVVELRDGPQLIFGDATRPRAKWAAAAAVLGDASSRGASYVDLRIPDRPAAGGVGAETVAPVGAAGTTTAPQPAPAGADPATPAPANPQPDPQGVPAP